MKTSKIGVVPIKSSGRKKVRIPLSHDVNTTCGFTEVQPLQCMLVPAKTKCVVQTESLVRLAPMNVPTFGRLDYEMLHYFVKLTDLSTNFAQLMAEKRVTRGAAETFQPKSLPEISVAQLTALALYGSHVTLWVSDAWVNNDTLIFKLPSTNVSSSDDMFRAIKQFVDNCFTYGTRTFDGYDGFSLCLDSSPAAGEPLIGTNIVYEDGNIANISNAKHWQIPLSNPKSSSFTYASFLDWRNTLDDSPVYDWNGINVSPVGLGQGQTDYVYVKRFTYTKADGTIEDRKIAMSFRLSDFGKMIRKILLGCGYQMDLTNSRRVSIMPLFAVYKAYFDSFGILRYRNYEDTACKHLLELYDNGNFTNFDFFNYNPNSSNGDSHLGYNEAMCALWSNEFIRDLAFMYTTDEQDWVSSMTDSFAIGQPNSASPINAPYITGTADRTIPDVAQQVSLSITNKQNQDPELSENGQGASYGNSRPNNHAFINSLYHGQLDCEILKSLYYLTNDATIIGQKVREALKAQGLGDWMDSQKINFIGRHTIELRINDVTSHSDTVLDPANNPQDGKQLGQWGANGLGYGKSKKFIYETDEIGYWVTLAYVRPRSGYCQAFLPSVTCKDKYSMYNPEFDGKGFEAVEKMMVCGALEWCNVDKTPSSRSELNKTFGYSPRYAPLKVCPNVMNGDFSLGSTKDGYLSYTLDKIIDVNTYKEYSNVTSGTGASLVTQSELQVTAHASELPIAGDIWRYTARYPWLGHLSRIFSSIGDPYEKFASMWSIFSGYDTRKFWEFFKNTVDNFLVHNIIYFDAYAPMLQIADSFETLEENEGKPSERIEMS